MNLSLRIALLHILTGFWSTGGIFAREFTLKTIVVVQPDHIESEGSGILSNLYPEIGGFWQFSIWIWQFDPGTL
jgi:hypothetical protein